MDLRMRHRMREKTIAKAHMRDGENSELKSKTSRQYREKNKRNKFIHSLQKKQYNVLKIGQNVPKSGKKQWPDEVNR